VPIGCHNEDSNASSGNMKDEMSKSEWSYYEEMFPEGSEDPFNSDSDFEYEDNYTKKKNKTVGKRGGKSKGVRRVTFLPEMCVFNVFSVYLVRLWCKWNSKAQS